MRLLKRKPSPALIVSIVAICAALVGTAFAAPIANDSRLTKQDRRIAAKIARNITARFIKRFTPVFADRQITDRAPGLSVAKADDAENAENAKSADSAKTAELAEVGFPRAWAFVNLNGTVNADFTKGVPNGTRPETGVYCFDLSFEPDHAQVSAEADAEADDIASVDLVTPTSCPAGTDVEVNTRDADSGDTNEAFYLTLW